MARKSYDSLTDLAKLGKQWHKLSGLKTREEWSAAVVRAATAAEVAANYAIRKEFKAQSQLDEKFIDKLLHSANGLAGKLDRLLIPITETDPSKKAAIKVLKRLSEKINEKRNSIVHQGEFCNESEALAVIEVARGFITTLIQLYKQDFELKERVD